MRRYLIAIAAVWFFLAAASANWTDTSTGIDLRKLPQFPLTKIRSGFLQGGSTATFDGITAVATSEPREVRLNGIGKSGKRWEAHMCCLDEVWRGDLDGNGTQDYVFFGAGPYFNGRTTPLFSIIILLMDADGIPAPFFTVVYKGESGDGIRHVVDLNRDSRAELLISSYDEGASDPRAGVFDSGHWVNQLFRFTNQGVEEVRGEFGGIKFPLIHDWTYFGPRYPRGIEPMPVQPAVLHEHGTSEDTQVTTAIRGPGESGFSLDIAPVSGCKHLNFGPIVYDRAALREISFPNLFSSYGIDLADTIRRDGVPVHLRGLDRIDKDQCSANLIWAAR